MSAKNKIYILPFIGLAALIACMACANYMWLRFNNQPPVDDEAFHLISALDYFRIMARPSADWLSRLVHVDRLYPPLFPFAASLIAFLFGHEPRTMNFCMANVFFLAGTLVCLYLIGLKLKQKWTGVLAACLFSFYPMIFHLSRMFMIETALTFMVTATIALLLYSDGFADRKMSLAAGAAFGLGLLTKQIYAVFIIGPAILLCAGFSGAPDAGKREKSAVNFFLFLVIGVLIALPWYWVHARHLYPWVVMASCNQAVVPFDKPVFSLQSFSYYPAVLVQHQIGVFFSIAFLTALVRAFRGLGRVRLFLAWILVPYFLLALFPNKYYYYTMPCLPAVAYVTAHGLLSLKNRFVRQFVVTALLAIGAFRFAIVSFWSMEPTKILYGSRYSPQRADYKISELIGRISEESGGQRPVIGTMHIDGNDIYKKESDPSDGYFLVNVHTLRYSMALRGFPAEVVDAGDVGNSAFQERFDFIISAEPLEDAGLLIDTFTMPDFSEVCLYKAAGNAVRPLAQGHASAPLNAVSSGDIRLILSRNTWNIFLKGRKLTDGLSVYTSIRSWGKWFDSRQCQWQIEKNTGTRLRARARYISHALMYQVWDFFVTGDTIYWNVETVAPPFAKLEREQANVMLSGTYTRWATPHAAGPFPDSFNKDYGGDWDVRASVQPGPEAYVGACAGAGEDPLPQVLFYCADAREGMVGNIVNSDDMFNGRVLQYVVKHGPFFFKRGGRYRYFNGYITIGHGHKTPCAPQ